MQLKSIKRWHAGECLAGSCRDRESPEMILGSTHIATMMGSLFRKGPRWGHRKSPFSPPPMDIPNLNLHIEQQHLKKKRGLIEQFVHNKG